jgi:protein SCO1
MTPQSKAFVPALLVAAAILGAGGAFLWRQLSAPHIELATGTYFSPQRALPNFSLIDQHGEPFGRRNLDGQWSLMFFGYTNCPDFCPTTLATLAVMEKNMRSARAAARPRVVFMSVDAKRDTPQQLAKYVPLFDSEFIGVTAPDQKTIERVARELGVAVVITPTADGSSYTVDHSGAIFVIDPEGRIAAILTGPFTADALQADFQRILAAHG